MDAAWNSGGNPSAASKQASSTAGNETTYTLLTDRSVITPVRISILSPHHDPPLCRLQALVASPSSLTHHPKYYFQHSLTVFSANTFVYQGPLHMLIMRFASPWVKSRLFRVHRRGFRWPRYLNTYIRLVSECIQLPVSNVEEQRSFWMGVRFSSSSNLPRSLGVLHDRGRGGWIILYRSRVIFLNSQFQ